MKNILLFVADQLAWKALTVYGDTYARTPNINSICQDAAWFERCYTPCPLCQPARASFWTSKYPHETGVRSNGRRWRDRIVGGSVTTLGKTFRAAGYETVHFGKTHDAGALQGFRVIRSEQERSIEEEPGLPLNDDTFLDCSTGRMTAEYISDYKSEKPFFVVADLVNPHNICGWIGEYAGTRKNPFLRENLPPLPENFRVDDMETRPKAVQYICCSHNRQAQAAGWDETKYRQYLYAYYYYLKLLDDEVGRILQALQKSGREKDTLIVFMSDHGESMAARGRVTKHVDLYEEVTRVPFVFKGPGILPRKKAIPGLASLLDLFPTLCGLCDLPIPQGLRGENLAEVLEGKAESAERTYAASEWQTEWGYTVTPGRMICTGRYKYMEYLENGDCELYDLQNDPQEKYNLAGMDQYREVLHQMKMLLEGHLKDTEDDFREQPVKVSASTRSHTPGYQTHTGMALPARVDEEERRRYNELFEVSAEK